MLPLTMIFLSTCKIDFNSLGNIWPFPPFSLSASLIPIIFRSVIRGCSSLFLCPKLLHGNNNNLLCGIQCSLCVSWKYYFLLKDTLCKHNFLNYHISRQRLEWLKKYIQRKQEQSKARSPQQQENVLPIYVKEESKQSVMYEATKKFKIKFG